MSTIFNKNIKLFLLFIARKFIKDQTKYIKQDNDYIVVIWIPNFHPDSSVINIWQTLYLSGLHSIFFVIFYKEILVKMIANQLKVHRKQLN